MKVYLLCPMRCECGQSVALNDIEMTGYCLSCKKPFPLPFIETEKPVIDGPKVSFHEVRGKRVSKIKR